MRWNFLSAVLFFTAVISFSVLSEGNAAQHVLPVPGDDSRLPSESQAKTSPPTQKSEPSMGLFGRFSQAEIEGRFAHDAGDKSIQSCKVWKNVFEQHFQQIEALQDAIRSFEESLAERPPASADEQTKNEWLKQTFVIQDHAAKKLADARLALEAFSPDEFFGIEAATVEWNGSAKENGLALSRLDTVSGLRVVSSDWQDQKITSHEILSVLESPFHSGPTRFQFAENSGKFIVSTKIYPSERCLLSPGWAGRLAPNGKTLGRNAIRLWVDVQSDYEVENTLKPEMGILQKRHMQTLDLALIFPDAAE